MHFKTLFSYVCAYTNIIYVCVYVYTHKNCKYLKYGKTASITSATHY